MKTVRPLRPKTYHRGALIDKSGNVSALCFKSPRAIDLSKSMWTNRDEAVTCPKCRALMSARSKLPTAESTAMKESALAKQGGAL